MKFNIIVLMIFMMSLSACGQSGRLYLPNPSSVSQTTPAK